MLVSGLQCGDAGLKGNEDGCHTPGSLSELPSTSGTCEQSRSETLPAHLGSVLGVETPGKWESRLEVKVYTSAQSFKPDISAVLTVMSGSELSHD